MAGIELEPHQVTLTHTTQTLTEEAGSCPRANVWALQPCTPVRQGWEQRKRQQKMLKTLRTASLSVIQCHTLWQKTNFHRNIDFIYMVIYIDIHSYENKYPDNTFFRIAHSWCLTCFEDLPVGFNGFWTGYGSLRDELAHCWCLFFI